VGVVSALALIGHSFMDGAGIGLAFQVSDTAGITVAIAVVAHDFCDGLNTVGLMLLHRNKTSHSLAMLLLDALAPVAGARPRWPHPAAQRAGALPGGFAGVLLYIGVADILPQAHSQAGPGTSLRLIGLTTLGAAVMYAVVRAAG
jgi:ZIP family zinc transporter